MVVEGGLLGELTPVFTFSFLDPPPSKAPATHHPLIHRYSHTMQSMHHIHTGGTHENKVAMDLKRKKYSEDNIHQGAHTLYTYNRFHKQNTSIHKNNHTLPGKPVCSK